MTIKQLLFSLSLVAVLGACSKSTNEPVLPNTQSGDGEPRVGLSLSGEIEFPDLDPDLPIGGGGAKSLTLSRFTRKSDGKRFVTPFFSDTKLPAIFCIYDGYGNSYFFRAAIEVSTTLSSNGQYVNKFHFNDKEIVGKNGKGLPDTRFKFIEKTKVTGRKQSSGVISYGEPGDENVYVAIFLGFDPPSNNPDDYSDHLRPETQTYTHGGWDTRIGKEIDYTTAGANTAFQTRIIFGTTPGKHKLTLDKEKGSGLGTPTGRHILSSGNLKLQMRGVLLECEIENNSGYDATLTSMRVNKWGGHSIVLREATSKSVKKGGTTVDEVDVLPDIEPDRSGDGRGPYDPFEIRFFGTENEKTVSWKYPNNTVKRIIYLPLVNALSNGKVTKTAATFRLRYTINGNNMAEEKLLRPLKRDGFMASTKFTLDANAERN